MGGGGGLYMWVVVEDCACVQWCWLYDFFIYF